MGDPPHEDCAVCTAAALRDQRWRQRVDKAARRRQRRLRRRETGERLITAVTLGLTRR